MAEAARVSVHHGVCKDPFSDQITWSLVQILLTKGLVISFLNSRVDGIILVKISEDTLKKSAFLDKLFGSL